MDEKVGAGVNINVGVVKVICILYGLYFLIKNAEGEIWPYCTTAC